MSLSMKNTAGLSRLLSAKAQPIDVIYLTDACLLFLYA